MKYTSADTFPSPYFWKGVLVQASHSISRRCAAPWRHLVAGLVIGLLVLVGAAGQARAQVGEEALLNLVNASPDGPIDIYLDETLVAANLEYKGETGYGLLPTREEAYRIRVFAAGADPTGTPALEGTMVADVVNAQTFIAYDQLSSLKAALLADDAALPEGEAWARFFHAAVGAPAVDVTLPEGATLFDDVAFGAAAPFVAVAPGRYTLQARPVTGGDSLLEVPDVAVEAGSTQMVVASGVAGSAAGIEVWVIDYPSEARDYPTLLADRGAAAQPTAAPSETPAATVAPTESAAVTATPATTPTTATSAAGAATATPEATAAASAAQPTPQTKLPTTGGDSDRLVIFAAQFFLLAGLLALAGTLFAAAAHRRASR